MAKKVKEPSLFDSGGMTAIEAVQAMKQVSNMVNKANKSITGFNLLALDIATHTGFCTDTTSGVWDLTPRKNESKGMRLIKFKASLREIIQSEQINLVVFEGAVTYGKFPNHVGVELQGVLKLFCEENGIEYRSYMPTEVKKFATGKGNSDKIKMIQAAKEKYGYEGNNDNEADAIHIYHLAISDLS